MTKRIIHPSTTELLENLNTLSSKIADLPNHRVRIAVPKLKEIGFTQRQIAELFGYEESDFSKKLQEWSKGGK